MTGNYVNKVMRRFISLPKTDENKPTIFHISHHKAGSQWIKEVLSQAEWRRVVRPLPHNLHVHDNPVRQGLIYPTVYLKQQDFNELVTSFPELRMKHFLVMRDLRDTLISLYFSLKYSHKVVSKNVGKQKNSLKDLDDEAGLLYLIDNGLKVQSDIQLSWAVNSDVKIYRYEDLLLDQESVFEDIFEFCEIQCDINKLKKIVRSNSFEKTSGGRVRGEENKFKHQRKGISGDWENYFTERVKDRFKEKFADTLVKTGYEGADNW